MVCDLTLGLVHAGVAKASNIRHLGRRVFLLPEIVTQEGTVIGLNKSPDLDKRVVPVDKDRIQRTQIRKDVANIRDNAGKMLSGRASDHIDCGVLPDEQLAKIREANRLLEEDWGYMEANNGRALGISANRKLQ